MFQLFNYLSLNSHLHVSFTQTQTRTANSLRVGKVGVQWLEYLYINITDVCLYIKFCSLHWARCLQCHWRAIKNMWQEVTKPRKRKQQVCTPAQGSRDATITIQGQVFNVRVPIISFQYAALSRVRVSMCVCALPSLFHNPARSIFQSGSHSVAGVEERKLADRLRYNPIHYSAAVRDRITILNFCRCVQESSAAYSHYKESVAARALTGGRMIWCQTNFLVECIMCITSWANTTKDAPHRYQ